MADEDDEIILGWCKDPFGLHELRWISRGQPTELVRDGENESKDPVPSEREPERPFIPMETIFGSPSFGPGRTQDLVPDYSTIAMDANVMFDSSAGGGGMSPSDGRPMSGWATSYEIKMRKRARKKRRAERWQQWFGRDPKEEV
jgi:hypothetical protein